MLTGRAHRSPCLPPPQHRRLTLHDVGEAGRASRRAVGVECFYEAGRAIRAAVALFKQRCPAPQPRNPSRFIRTAVHALETRQNLRHPGSGGRPPKVTAADARLAVDLVWRGYVSEGRRVWYRSIRHALAQCAALRQLLARCGCSVRTLQRAMKAAEPECRRRRLVVKRVLTPANRNQRLAVARHLRANWGPQRLLRVFWVDAATIYVVPKGMLAYAPPSAARDVVADPRLPSHSSNVLKLRFYMCVSAIGGPVALVFTTGTTGLEGLEWLVSAGWVRGVAERWRAGLQAGRALVNAAPLRVRCRVIHKATWLFAPPQRRLHVAPPAGLISPVQAQQPRAAR